MIVISKQFPIIYHKQKQSESDRRRSVPWDMLAPFEERAKKFHGQTLSTLAERHGLGPAEILALVHDDKKLWFLPEDDSTWDRLEALVVAHEGPQPATEIEYLRWFYKTGEFGIDLDELKKHFEKETGKKVPVGY